MTVSGYPPPHAPGSSYGPQPEPRYLMYMNGVALLIPPDRVSDEAGVGQEAVGGLALGADQSGLVILGPRPGERRVVPWGSIGGIGSNGFVSLRSGLRGYSLTLVSGQRTIEFVLPADGFGAGGIGGLVATLSSFRDNFSGHGVGYGTGYPADDVGYTGYGAACGGYSGSYGSYPDAHPTLSARAVSQVRLASKPRARALLALGASVVVLLGGGSLAWYLTRGGSPRQY